MCYSIYMWSVLHTCFVNLPSTLRVQNFMHAIQFTLGVREWIQMYSSPNCTWYISKVSYPTLIGDSTLDNSGFFHSFMHLLLFGTNKIRVLGYKVNSFNKRSTIGLSLSQQYPKMGPRNGYILDSRITLTSVGTWWIKHCKRKGCFK